MHMALSIRIFTQTAGRKVLSSERILEGASITIGRSKSCTLSLEDPELQLSRVQAELVRTGPGYMLKVVSKNSPVEVNGRSHAPGSQTMVGPGDTLGMAGYELEILGDGEMDSDPEATRAVPARPRTAAPEPQRVVPEPPPAAAPAARLPPEPVRGPAAGAAPAAAPLGVQTRRSGRGLMIGAGFAAVLIALGSFLLWPSLKGMLPDQEVEKQAALDVARLEGEARSLIKLLDAERRERKEAVAASARDIARIEEQLRAARTSTEKAGAQAALREARNTAALNTLLEQKVRDQTDGQNGLPKAEGNLSAAASAAKSKDNVVAAKILQETVALLTAARAKIADDRKAAQSEQLKRQDQLQVAETKASAEAEARAKAETEARSRTEIQARIKSELDARAKKESQARAATAPEPAARAENNAATASKTPPAASGSTDCVAKLAGAWVHATGGTWTFSGKQGTLVVNSSSYGPKAQQITVLSLSSCDADTMTYKIVRTALVNTADASFQYDRTPASAPNLPNWVKDYTQPYAISVNGLKFGNFIYAKR